jgi:hypothetical protein
MNAFRLPLSRHHSEEIVGLLLRKERLGIARPRTRDADLTAASLIDELAPRLALAEEKARAGHLFTAAKVIDDFLEELSTERPWNLLAGRYVERRMIDEDNLDVYGEPDVEPRKVLVVKLSRLEAEPDYTVDRSGEARQESNNERCSDEDCDAGMSELVAWGGEFWRELTGWHRGQKQR